MRATDAGPFRCAGQACSQSSEMRLEDAGMLGGFRLMYQRAADSGRRSRTSVHVPRLLVSRRHVPSWRQTAKWKFATDKGSLSLCARAAKPNVMERVSRAGP